MKELKITIICPDKFGTYFKAAQLNKKNYTPLT